MASKAIEVLIWGKSVGAVALDPALGYYVFGYAREWLREGVELAPRTMPVAHYRGPYVFTQLGEQTYRRLPGMLADALPDDFGNALINAFRIVDQVIAMTGGGPNNASTLLLFYIYQVAFSFWDSSYAAALSTVLLLLLGTIALAQFYLLDRKVHYR